MRSDEQIIFVRGKPALRCGRAIFFRRPEMLEGIGKSRVRDGGADAPIVIEPAQATNSAPATRKANTLPSKAARAEIQDWAPLSEDDSEEPAPPRYASLGTTANDGPATPTSVSKCVPITPQTDAGDRPADATAVTKEIASVTVGSEVSREIDCVVAAPLSDEATHYLWLVGLAPVSATAEPEALPSELDGWARTISEDRSIDAPHRSYTRLPAIRVEDDGQTKST